MLKLAHSHFFSLNPYIPGRPLKETQHALGLPKMIKLASNENAFGASPMAKQAILKELDQVFYYPNSGRPALKARVAERHKKEGIGLEHIVLGNGSNELITLLVRTLLSKDESLVNPWPSFIMYRIAAQIENRSEITVPLNKNFDYDVERLVDDIRKNRAHKPKMLFIANPNNPTGAMLKRSELDFLIEHIPEDLVLVLDQAYAEYVQDKNYPNGVEYVLKRPRTVVLRTFSKAFGLAGLRVGYAVCDTQIADLLHRVREPFNVNSLAQCAALAALDDVEFVHNSVEKNKEEKAYLQKGLSELPLFVKAGEGNFIYIDVQSSGWSMSALSDRLLGRGVIIRPLPNYGLSNAARVTIGKREENDVFLSVMKELMAERPQAGGAQPWQP